MSDRTITAAEEYREPLLLEASLAASSLGAGLTALRRYSFADKGHFFVAMFGVTVGVERIIKLSIVLDALLRTSAPPTDRQLRDIGHGISAGVACVRRLNATHRLEVDEGPFQDPLSQRIVELLAVFAERARYYNLDVVTGSTRAASEPLATWTRDVCTEILNRHFRLSAVEREDLASAEDVAQTPGIVVEHRADDGSPITDLGALAAHSATAETKQRYSVFYVHRIARFCIQVLEALDMRFSPPLYVSEAFRAFDMIETRAILRRKRWNP